MAVSGLASAIKKELDRQGKSWRWLAIQTGLAESTFNKWRNDPQVTPDLKTLSLVSEKLSMPLRVLIEACGFPVDESANYADRQARARALLAAVPGLADIIDDLVQLLPEDQDTIMTMIETHLRKKEDRRRRRQQESP
jgi:hypothetical protein